MTSKHIADAEGGMFLVLNVEPDLCVVNGTVVPFDIFQWQSAEHSKYAKATVARGENVLMRDSTVGGVNGNAGKGIFSGTSRDSGVSVVAKGCSSVIVEGVAVAHDGSVVRMNCWLEPVECAM